MGGCPMGNASGVVVCQQPTSHSRSPSPNPSSQLQISQKGHKPRMVTLLHIRTISLELRVGQQLKHPSPLVVPLILALTIIQQYPLSMLVPQTQLRKQRPWRTSSPHSTP